MYADIALLHAVAIALHHTENWGNPFLTLMLVALAIWMAMSRASVWPFALVLLLSTYDLLWKFPNIANHSNLILLLNFLFAGFLCRHLLARKGKESIDERFEPYLPLLRWALVLVYFFAAFHKLNWDFLNPDVTCGAWMGDRIQRQWLGHAQPLPPAVRLAQAVIGLSWEIAIVLGLLFRRTRLLGLILAVGLHVLLAQAMFFDFGAAAMTCLFAFVPRPLYRDLYARRAASSWPDPVLAYTTAAVVAGITSGVLFASGSIRPQTIDSVQGVAFALGAVCLWRPLVRWGIASRSLGLDVDLLGTLRRPAVAALIAPLLVLGLSPYLGLRTAGNFSMFSNLRVEGERSNHLLLARNPLKVFPYVDDIVWFRRVPPKVARWSRRAPVEGEGLPAVEFRRFVHEWRARGMSGLRFVVTYRGEDLIIEDVTRDPLWAGGHLPAGFFLKFRTVQRDGPNRCRW